MMDNLYIEKVLNGNTESFRYFIRTYKDYAFSLSFSILKNTYYAEEAVQDAFIKAFENLSSFKKESKFKTWFGRIVINESLKKFDKKQKEELSIDKVSENFIKTIEDTLYNIEVEDRKILISNVFESLHPNESLVLELYYLKENSINEILELTGWSKPKTKMLLLRGRKSFYHMLSKILKYKLEELI